MRHRDMKHIQKLKNTNIDENLIKEWKKERKTHYCNEIIHMMYWNNMYIYCIKNDYNTVVRI